LAFLDTHAGDLSEDSQTRLQTNPLRILDSKDKGDRAILAEAPRLDEYLNDISKAHFAAVTESLDKAGIAWRFDPLLVRGLDYYCHTAFEFITDDLGAQGTVLGGGRYDGLSEMLGGPPVPGVGWAAGVERLAMLAGAEAPVAPPVAVMPMDDDAGVAAYAVAEMLRDAGIAVDVPTGGAIGKRLKKADRAGVRIAVILGSDEIAGGTAQLRDLTTGTQDEIAQADLSSHLAGTLANHTDGTSA
jgi:histidyl-tRNA synthetase